MPGKIPALPSPVPEAPTAIAEADPAANANLPVAAPATVAPSPRPAAPQAAPDVAKKPASSPARVVPVARTDPPSAPVSEPTSRGAVGEPVSFEPIILDGSTFSSLGQVKRAVAFVNNASREELLAAGIHEMVVDTVLTNRPYASLQKFAYTKGIGDHTMAAVERHTREDSP
jgi:hypothetical protein